MKRDFTDRSGEMEILARVVATGSLSAAARDLGLTPSGVSRVIARMELRLGVRLLVRTTRALALTPEGENTIALAFASWTICGWPSRWCRTMPPPVGHSA